MDLRFRRMNNPGIEALNARLLDELRAQHGDHMVSEEFVCLLEFQLAEADLSSLPEDMFEEDISI